MNIEEANDMVLELMNLERDDMSNWEWDFLTSIKKRCWNNNNNLSQKQADTLIQIYERYIE